MKKALFSFIALATCLVASAKFEKQPWQSTKGKGFIENVGQFKDQHGNLRADLDFKFEGAGVNTFVGSGQLRFLWVKADELSARPSGGKEFGPKFPEHNLVTYRLELDLIGANPDAKIKKSNQLSGFEQFFFNTESQNGTKAYTYTKITYENVYPQIDWVLYTDGSGDANKSMKYDFVVKPGGDPRMIKLAYTGASSLSINKDGSFSALTPFGTHKEAKPISYYLGKDGKVQPVRSNYILENNVIRFDVAANPTGTLVIDPAIEWSTYFGGTGYDMVHDLAKDQVGNMYMSGTTLFGANFATVGAHQVVLGADNFDAFLVKFDSSGNRLWATYYGGNDMDYGNSIICDNSNNVYLGGTTHSLNNIATTGMNSTLTGLSDNFIAKFNSSGQRIWARYIGSSQNDLLFRMAISNSGKLYITGNTDGANYPVLNAHQAVKAGLHDAFLTSVDTNGQILWSTFYGTTKVEMGRGVAIDSDGNVYLAGVSEYDSLSSNALSTQDAHQTSNGGSDDLFLVKFDSLGVRQWATYYGGSEIEYQTEANMVSIDHLDHIYLAASTQSANNISTPGSFQEVKNNDRDAFIVKFKSNGDRIWATYLGGPGMDYAAGVIPDNQGSVYLVGNTESYTNFATPTAHQLVNHQGGGDGFIVKFNNQGNRVYGTYFGGYGPDVTSDIEFDANGRLYISGYSASSINISTPNAFQPSIAGLLNGFLAKFCVSNPTDLMMGSDTLCSGNTYTFTVDTMAGAISYIWNIPNQWTGSSNTNSITVNVLGNGLDSISVSVVSCDTSELIMKRVFVSESIEPVIVVNSGTLSTQSTHVSYQWLKDQQPISGANSATYTPLVDGNYQVAVTNVGGCTDTSDVLNYNGVKILSPESLADDITIYPNPTKGDLFLKAKMSLNLVVYSADGRLVFDAKEVNKIDVSHLDPGVYFIEISTIEGLKIRTERFTKLK